MRFKERINAWLERTGLTPDEAGKRIGASGQTIRNWIRGYSRPNAAHVARLAKELREPLATLLEEVRGSDGRKRGRKS